jgi:PDZ domain-containing protein
VTDQPVTTAEYEPLAAPEPPSRIEPRTLVMLIGGFSAVLLASLVALMPVKYAVLHPGPVLNTLGAVDGKSLIAISGHPTYPTSGQLDLTTVSVVGGPGRQLTLLQVIEGWLDKTSAVVPEEQVFPAGQTQKQSDEQNTLEMMSSQESATAAALTTLGITFPTTLSVAGIEPGSPASKVLKAGDVIIAVNGHRIADLAALRKVLGGVDAGAKVRVEVRRKGATETLSAATTRSTDDGHTVLGVFVDPAFTFPFSVKIQIEDIGGPSAGTMFALGIIDKLTPGDLAAGQKIAGTGTIDADGQVGPIGGIRQKLVGARRAGATYFLAPASNCVEVRRHIPDGLQVYKISTLTQARDVVQAIAGHRTTTLGRC